MSVLRKRLPILLSLLCFVVAMLLPWGAFYEVFLTLGDYWGGCLRYGMAFFLSLGLLFLLHHRFPFPLGGGVFLKDLLTFGLVGLIGSVMGFLFSVSALDRTPSFWEVVSYVLYCLLVALAEETLFREVIFPLLLEAAAKTQNGEAKATFGMAALFGLRHLLGLLENPGSYALTSAQVVFTFMAGVYLGAILLRTHDIAV
jgi:membrane protease YdiL (CAAX protease family)